MVPETPHGNNGLTKALQLIGLAVRAGKCVTGTDAVLMSLTKAQACIVWLAEDAGENALKKFRDKCAFYHIPLLRLADRTLLGRAIGRSQCIVLALTDPGFAARIKELAGESFGGEAFDETSRL